MSGTWPLAVINRLEYRERGAILHQASSMNNPQSYYKPHTHMLANMYNAQGLDMDLELCCYSDNTTTITKQHRLKKTFFGGIF